MNEMFLRCWNKWLTNFDLVFFHVWGFSSAAPERFGIGHPLESQLLPRPQLGLLALFAMPSYIAVPDKMLVMPLGER